MKKNDIILCIAVVVVAAVAGLILLLNKEEGGNVMVYVGGYEYETYSLSEEGIHKIDIGSGMYNTFEIKDGKAVMVEASCPDKLCMSQREIHYNHETITCLPNLVVLQVEGGEENAIDGQVN